MVENAAANPTSPNAQKIGDAYAAWMDEAGIEARGLAPLKPYLDRIDAVSNRNQLVQLMMDPSYAGPINIGIATDQDDPTRYTASAGQARLGLPTRDYYLLKGEKYDSIRSAYRQYIVDLGKLAGLSDPEGRADRIIALETRLSKDQWTPERRRDPVATHNLMTRAQLMKLAPQFNWTPNAALDGPRRGEDGRRRGNRRAVAAAGKRIADVPLETWKEYLDLPLHQRPCRRAAARVRRGQLRFLRQDPVRRSRAARALEARHGHARRQPRRGGRPALRRRALAGRDGAPGAGARRRHARRLCARRSRTPPGWTRRRRKAALEKLARFDPRIGHPVKWIDYSTFKVEPDRRARQ